jgi:hypothetical protein
LPDCLPNSFPENFENYHLPLPAFALGFSGLEFGLTSWNEI